MSELYREQRKLTAEDPKRVKQAIESFAESQDLTISSSPSGGNSIQARSPSGSLRGLPNLHYDYLWQIEEGKEFVNVAFSLHIPTTAKIAAYSFLVLSGLLFLLSWTLFSIWEISRWLGLQLVGFFLPLLPALTLLRGAENRMDTFWKEMKERFPESKVVKERRMAGPSLARLYMILVATVLAVDLTLRLLAIAEAGMLKKPAPIPLLIILFALLIYGLVNWPYLLEGLLGERFKRLEKLLRAGITTQIATASPPILLLFFTVAPQGSSPISLVYLCGALALWILILAMFWSISRSNPEEFIKSKLERKPNQTFSPKLSPGSKVVLITWLLLSPILLVGMPVSLLLLGDPSNLLLISEKFGISSSGVWVATALYLSPTLFVGAGLIRENFKSFRQTRFALKEARDHLTDPRQEKKFGQIRERVEEEVKRFGLPYRKVKVLAVDEDSLKCQSATTGVININGYILLSTALLEKLSLRELKALAFHEVHHLKYDSSLLTKLRILSKWTAFGNGLLAGVIDFAAREHLADKYAAKKAGPAILAQALRKFRREKVAAEIAGNSLGFSFTRHQDQEPKEGLSRFSEAYRILFKDYIPFYSHPTLKERIKFIEDL